MINPEASILPKQYRYEEDAFQRKHWTKKILDIENGTILGRTTHQWILLVLYLVCFYVLLVLLWAMCFWVFMSNIDMKKPRCTMSQPGLCMIPTIHTIPSKIVYVNRDEESISRITEAMNATLKKFGPLPANYFYKCIPKEEYGFNENKPCIFLKINRSIGFVTKPYMNTTDMPADAPSELTEFIDNIPYKNRTSRIWIHCNVDPKIRLSYHPNQYVESKHITLSKKRAKKKVAKSKQTHSFYDKRDFNRIIAVRFSRLNEKVVYNFNCSLWAKNIVRKRDGRNSQGIVYGSIRVLDHEESNGCNSVFNFSIKTLFFFLTFPILQFILQK